MKAIKWILGGAISIVLGLFLTAALQEPINNFFRSDRISADFVLAPWHPGPTDTVEEKSATPGSAANALDALVNEISTLSEGLGSSHLGRLTLENRSEKVITNIKVKFGDNKVDTLLDAEEDTKDIHLKRVSEIVVPDLKPGDKLVYYIWSNVYGDPSYFTDNIDTYSSTGKFRITYSWPEVREDDDGALDDFLDEWMSTIVIVALILACSVLWIVGSLFEDHVKKLLGDSSFYDSRKAKFDLNPKAYNAFDSDSSTTPEN